jgi:hypothetical protein
MRRELMDRMRSAAGKLLRVRAAEAAAVCATAAALAAAAVQSAWAVAYAAPTAAAGICLLPAALGIWIALSPGAGRALRLGRLLRVLAGGVCVAAGAGGAAAVAGGWHVQVSKAVVPLILLPVGAILGALGALLRRPTPRDAAVLLDRRGGLRERLSTAVELASSADADAPVARFVYAQALAGLRARRPQRGPMWRRSRATAAALGLSLVLCAALAFVPTVGLRGEGDVIGRLAGSLDALSPAQKQALAEALRAAARDADDEQTAQKHVEAARMVELGDAEQLRKLLGELKRAGLKIEKVVPGDVLAAAGIGAGGEPGAGGRAALAAKGTGWPPSPNGSGPPRDASQAPEPNVRVYDPLYEELVKPGTAPAKGPGGGGQEGMVGFDDARAAHRARAASALTSDAIPPKYRPIVRDFFLADD